jgi:hypothetical protein
MPLCELLVGHCTHGVTVPVLPCSYIIFTVHHPKIGLIYSHRSLMTMENAKPGHEVEFQGLKSAVHLNGTRGYLVAFDKEAQRWSVRCNDDGEIVNTKPENLKRVEIPAQPFIANFPMRTPAVAATTLSSHGDVASLHEAVLNSYYNRRKGGVVVSYGDSYMIAIEYFGPSGNGGIIGDMVYVDKNPKARAVVQGRRCARATELGTNFLLGETVDYIEATNEDAFFTLLSRCKRHSSSEGLIDIKSGLKLYKTRI